MQQFIKWRRAVWVVVALLIALWIFRDPILELLRFISHREDFVDYISGFGILGPIILASLHLLQVLVAMMPGDVFFFAAGYIYGLRDGYLFNVIVTAAASLVAFGIARRWGRPVVNRLASSVTIDRWDKAARRYGFVFFLISYLLPIFPADTMNYVAGLSLIPWQQFAAATVLGRAPSILLMTVLGAYGYDLASLGWSLQIWILIGLAAVGLYAGWIYFFNKMKNEVFKT